jgi:hypothetical protein
MSVHATGCQSNVQQPRDSATETPYKLWPCEPPAGCPFQKSQSITGIAFGTRHAGYGDADTWYPSWASNGNLYSPSTDGTVAGVKSVSGSECCHE